MPPVPTTKGKKPKPVIPPKDKVLPDMKMKVAMPKVKPARPVNYGCICPPGANLTCKAKACPRQGAKP